MLLSGDKQSTASHSSSNFEIILKRTGTYKESLNDFINFTDNFGKTPLHYACKNNNINLVKILCLSNANTFIRDYKNRVSFETSYLFRNLWILRKNLKLKSI